MEPEQLIVAGLNAVSEINRQNNLTLRQQSLNQSRPVKSEETKKTEYHNDAFIPGQKLQNYTTRTADPDGQFVRVVQHKEWIEKIKQPPTEEEKAQVLALEELRIKKHREANKTAAIVVGACAGAMCLLYLLDKKGHLNKISKAL